MTELISVKQDIQGTRYLIAGGFSVCNENWQKDTTIKRDLIIEKQEQIKN